MTYELVVLLHPDLEIDLDKPLARVEKIVKDAGGSVLKTDNWGKRKLAYPIRGQEFAIYVYFEVEMPGEQVDKLDRSFKIIDEVLRHLITKHVEPPAEDSKKPSDDTARPDVSPEEKSK